MRATGDGIYMQLIARVSNVHGPEGYNNDELVVFTYDALAELDLSGDVLAQQAAAARRAMTREGELLASRLVGNVRRRPDLAVRVRIARAHHLAAVFAHERVLHPRMHRHRGALVAPRLHE